jgi:hypothetical protein
VTLHPPLLPHPSLPADKSCGELRTGDERGFGIEFYVEVGRLVEVVGEGVEEEEEEEEEQEERYLSEVTIGSL